MRECKLTIDTLMSQVRHIHPEVKTHKSHITKSHDAQKPRHSKVTTRETRHGTKHGTRHGTGHGTGQGTQSNVMTLMSKKSRGFCVSDKIVNLT